MKVSENELYRALYCGLCRAMGRQTGCLSRLSLSYDFVFLCAFRAALTKTELTIGRHRCAVHPLVPRAMAEEDPVLTYAARAAAYLQEAKVEDDLADERGARRAAARLLSPAARSVRRRAEKAQRKAGGALCDWRETLAGPLGRLSALEKTGCDSIDETAACFGELLGAVFAGELTGREEKIARAAGDAVGRFIYVADAADDAADDCAAGRYNPIVRRYGAQCIGSREATDARGRTAVRPRLALPIAESLYAAALHELNRLAQAEALIDPTGTQPEVLGIVRNIVYLGIPAQLRRVLALPEHPFAAEDPPPARARDPE